MPSGMLPIQDGAPIHGMNTVDDPRTLSDGEVANLINVFPQNPPVPRNGCVGYFRSFSENALENCTIKPPVMLFYYGGRTNLYAIAWIYNEAADTYSLVSFLNNETGVFRTLAAAKIGSNSTDVKFGMISLNDWIYSFSNYPTTQFIIQGFPYSNPDPNENVYDISPHKIIESPSVVRSLCISEPSFEEIFISQQASEDPEIQRELGNYLYGFQFVRRNDVAAFENGSNQLGVILPPNIAEGSEPHNMTTLLPGICIGLENPANRQQIAIDYENSVVNIVITFESIERAIQEGATHLRVCRSRKQSTDATGATMFFLADLALTNDNISYVDSVSDVALSLETNQLVTGYTAAPGAPFGKHHKGRLFLMDITGRVYYSESVGGGGFIELDMAQEYPQAWASMFKPLVYFIDCDMNDGINASGIEILQNDIYFFKESKIFVLYGGNPLDTTVTTLSSTIGCQFPFTLKQMQIPNLGTVLFFISNMGPAIIEAGGQLRLFSEFKIKDLWPDLNDRTALFSDFYPYNDFNIESCCSMFYKNTIWVFFTNYYGYCKTYGYYIDPNEKNIQGSMEIQLAEDTLIKNAIAVYDEVQQNAFLYGKNENKIALYEFLKKDSFVDSVYSEEDSDATAKYNIEIQSRVLYPGPEEKSFSELFDILLLCDFLDDAEEDNDFIIGITSDFARCFESANYYLTKQYTGEIPTLWQPTLRHSIQVVPQVGFYGIFYQYTIKKRVPSDGKFEFFGMRGNAVPVNADPEFIASLGEITNGWDN